MGRYKQWSDEDIAKVAEMREAGMRWSAIAEAYGCTVEGVSNVYYRRGKRHERDKYAEAYDDFSAAWNEARYIVSGGKYGRLNGNE